MKLFQKSINLLKKLKSKLIKFHLNGKEIDLTGDNVIIKSNNFNVNEKGHVEIIDTEATDAYTIEDTNLKIRDKNDDANIAMCPNRILLKKSSMYTTLWNTGEASWIIVEDISKGLRCHMAIAADMAVIRCSDGINQTQITSKGIETPEVKITNGGTAMYGMEEGHKYRCHWTGSQLQFWVDETNVGTLSDKRLKVEIKEIDNNFIQAIKEIEMKQFKIVNRGGLISFGILAQDLIEVFKKYNISPFDYEIVYKTQYKTDDDTIYYAINYEQFLILKTKAQELEIKELQEKDKQKDEIIQNLLERVQALEKGANNE